MLLPWKLVWQQLKMTMEQRLSSASLWKYVMLTLKKIIYHLNPEVEWPWLFIPHSPVIHYYAPPSVIWVIDVRCFKKLTKPPIFSAKLNELSGICIQMVQHSRCVKYWTLLPVYLQLRKMVVSLSRPHSDQTGPFLARSTRTWRPFCFVRSLQIGLTPHGSSVSKDTKQQSWR